MKSKIQKVEELKTLKTKLSKSKIVVFTAFSQAGEKGLSVSQMTELKRLLRSTKSEYLVAKKTLIDLALKSLKVSLAGQADFEGYDGVDVLKMNGSVGVAMGDDDGYVIAKKLYEFSKKNQALHFFGALFEGNFVDADKFLEMAKLPSKETLIGRLVGMLTYPMKGLAVALSEVAKQKSLISKP